LHIPDIRPRVVSSSRSGDVTMPEMRPNVSAATSAPRPLVSVVIPSYNYARFLGDAIESVIRQVYDRVEIVVVDDGSTDDTAAVVARYPDVKYVRQENQGLGAARNAGIRHATGEFVVFLDADDRLLPDALAAGVDSLRDHPDAAFTWGRFRYVDSGGSPLDEMVPPSPEDVDDYRALLRMNHIVSPATVMYRRAILERVGGFDLDASVRASEDYDLYLRLASEYPICRHVALVAEYRKHDANMSTDASRMLNATLAVLTKQARRANADPERRAALREGVRFYRDLYAEQLLGQLRRDPRRLRDRGEATRGMMAMLRFGPKWVGRRTMGRARRSDSSMQQRLAASGRVAQVSDRLDDRSLPAVPVVVIRPPTGWVRLGIRELWEYRELLFFFVWRDLKVRYKQTLLGASWAILQPFFTMLVFSVFFGRLARIPSDGVPYPVFSFAALVPWTFFATGLTHASTSVVLHQGLIKKVYFPRLSIPIASVLAGVFDFMIAFAVLIVMQLYFGVMPTRNVVWVPALLALALVTALGAALWFSALYVRYRDVQYLVPFVAQMWLFATPVAYPSSLLGEPWRTIYGLNPMAGVVEGFRWALLGTSTAPGPMIAVSSLAAIALLVGGAYFFRRMESSFADVV
jgi:lipopolysaccharide transport system permease protein